MTAKEDREIAEAEVRLSGEAVCPKCGRVVRVFDLSVPMWSEYLVFRVHYRPNITGFLCPASNQLVFPT